MDLNELKSRVEETGRDWNDALAKIKEATNGKDIATAMKEGWKVEDFAKLLLNGDTAETQEESLREHQPPEKPTQPEAESFVPHMEAPASLNTYYISPGGFRWQFTIRPGLAAKEMTALLERARKAEEWLTKKGYTPYVPFKTGNANAGGQQAGGNGGEAPLCPTHGKPMLPSKHGEGYYCPVKIAEDDGTGKPVYCKQRVK